MMKRYNWEFWVIPKIIAKDEKVSMLESFLIGILATLTNGENDSWPGTKKLAEILRCKEETILRALQRLESKGYIEVKRHKEHQRIQSYKLFIPPKKINVQIDNLPSLEEDGLKNDPSSGEGGDPPVQGGGTLFKKNKELQSETVSPILKENERYQKEKELNQKSTQIIEFFHLEYLNYTGGEKYKFSGEDRVRIKNLLKEDFTVERIKEIISCYRNSKKINEHGFSLRVALSQDTINKFTQGML